MNTFKFTGKIKEIKNGLTTKYFPNKGWSLNRLRFIASCGTNTQFVEISGGKFSEDSGRENVVYTLSKQDDQKKCQKLTIAWEDRNKPEVIAKVAHFKKYIIDLYKDGDAARKVLIDSGDVFGYEESKKLKFEYIHELDFIDKINEILQSESMKDYVFKITGEVEYSYSEKDGSGRVFSSFKPTSIVRVNDEAEQSSVGVSKLFFDSNAVVESENALLVNCYTPYYNNVAKKDLYAPVQLTIPNDDSRLNGFKSMFSNIEKGKVKTVDLLLDYVNGSVKKEITIDELDDDTKDIIALGLLSVDDAIQALGGSTQSGSKSEKRIITFARKCTHPVYDDNVLPEYLTEAPTTYNNSNQSIDADYDDLI